jgi:uncharacterized membrane protein YdfJ with MMPL/SSD domain
MTAVTRWVLGHKLLVTAFWAVVTVVGIATVGSTTRSFSNKFSAPGREGFTTNATIVRRFGNGADTVPFVVVTTLSPGTPMSAPAVRRDLSALEARLHRGYRAPGPRRSPRPGTERSSRPTAGPRSRTPSRPRTTRASAGTPPQPEPPPPRWPASRWRARRST